MIKIIVAVDKEGAIGKDNDLLYNIKDDLKNFKELTTGNIVVMGKNTWKSLPIKPLPNRENIVLSNSIDSIEGAKVMKSLEEVKEYIDDLDKDTYIIGGAAVYNEAIEKKLVDEAHVTFVDDEYKDADTFISINKLKSILPKQIHICNFKEDDLKAEYVVLRG